MRELINLVENMQLNELRGYRQTDEFKAFQDILAADPLHKDRNGRGMVLIKFSDFLQKRQFKLLGKGAFGITFEHPGLDYVIKVFRNDPAYLAYVGYILKNKGNPYLPVFRGRFMKLDDENYVVRMERLKSLDTSNLRRDVLTTADRVESYGAQQWLYRCRRELAPVEVDDRFDANIYQELEKKTAEAEDAYNAVKNKFDNISKQVQKLQYEGGDKKRKDREPNSDQPQLNLLGGAGQKPDRYHNLDEMLDAYVKLVRQRFAAFQAALVAQGEMEKFKPIDKQNWMESEMKFSLAHEGFCTTIDEIIKLGFSCDFHGGNFMIRGETPVITDPLFDSSNL